jgi:DNA modification methylase
MPVINIDCRVGLSLFPDNSIDAIVTDPPYELSAEYCAIANARIDAA